MSEAAYAGDGVVTKPNTRLKPPWQPGQSGNPAGRPKGSRVKLTEAFLRDLAGVWQDQGIEVARKVAKDDPSTFLRVVASLIPKTVALSVDTSLEGVLAEIDGQTRGIGAIESTAKPIEPDDS